MASIDEVRAGITQATQKAEQSLGALQQAQSHVEEAQQLLQRVTEGTSQADAQEAVSQLQQAASSINDVQQMVQAAVSTAEGTAQRL
jgi:uncharacterized phage infection (PIP) family protein YhgE